MRTRGQSKAVLRRKQAFALEDERRVWGVIFYHRGTHWALCGHALQRSGWLTGGDGSSGVWPEPRTW